jgi:hypothetical protein
MAALRRRQRGDEVRGHGFEVLDVHHHVGDAFTALGGELDTTTDPGLPKVVEAMARAEKFRVQSTPA